jgi:hypothetical protein
MRLASNVVVHSPESKPGKIETDRLRAHGWSEEVVRDLERDQQQSAAASERNSANP